jgi:hypothetical protein
VLVGTRKIWRCKAPSRITAIGNDEHNKSKSAAVDGRIMVMPEVLVVLYRLKPPWQASSCSCRTTSTFPCHLQ